MIQLKWFGFSFVLFSVSVGFSKSFKGSSVSKWCFLLGTEWRRALHSKHWLVSQIGQYFEA
jgi:hypothetical protein